MNLCTNVSWPKSFFFMLVLFHLKRHLALFVFSSVLPDLFFQIPIIVLFSKLVTDKPTKVGVVLFVIYCLKVFLSSCMYFSITGLKLQLEYLFLTNFLAFRNLFSLGWVESEFYVEKFKLSWIFYLSLVNVRLDFTYCKSRQMKTLSFPCELISYSVYVYADHLRKVL